MNPNTRFHSISAILFSVHGLKECPTFCPLVPHPPLEADSHVVRQNPGPGLTQARQGALHPVPVLGRAIHAHSLAVPVPLAGLSQNWNREGSHLMVLSIYSRTAYMLAQMT